jgi:hypothetical protein
VIGAAPATEVTTPFASVVPVANTEAMMRNETERTRCRARREGLGPKAMNANPPVRGRASFWTTESCSLGPPVRQGNGLVPRGTKHQDRRVAGTEPRPA